MPTTAEAKYANTSTKPVLFRPARVGNMNLLHRVVMSPLGRLRSDNNFLPLPIAKEYYEQRARAPSTFIISEATVIAPQAGEFNNVSGIWSDEQIERWK